MASAKKSGEHLILFTFGDPQQLAGEAFRRVAHVFDAILLGIGAGTVIDMAAAPRLLAPPDSPLVENAMAPMLAAAAVVFAITVTYLLVAAHMFLFPRFDIRRRLRHPVRFQLRLAYHAYLLFAAGGIALWTHVYFWHGQRLVWTFGVVLVYVVNLFVQLCRMMAVTDR